MTKQQLAEQLAMREADFLQAIEQRDALQDQLRDLRKQRDDWQGMARRLANRGRQARQQHDALAAALRDLLKYSSPLDVQTADGSWDRKPANDARDAARAALAEIKT